MLTALSNVTGPMLYVMLGTAATNVSFDAVITTSKIVGFRLPALIVPVTTCQVPAIVGAGPVELEHATQPAAERAIRITIVRLRIESSRMLNEQ
jgi:hypothetical protein